MKTFVKGMDIFRDVLTAGNLNEIGGAVRSVGELRERLAAGDLAPSNSIRCFSASPVARGRCVVPVGIEARPEALSPSGAVRPPLTVRAAMASDAGSVWGIALESAAAGVAFRCAFSGFAVVPLAASADDGAWLAPGADGTPVRTSSVTRCRILAVVDAEPGGADDAPAAYALVRMDDIGAAPCPQWRISATPPEEEGGKWTVAVQGGSVVVSDISLDSSGGAGGGSGGSGGGGSGGGDDDEGGSGHSHGGGGRSGDAGFGDDAIRVPTISYGG